MAIKRIPYTVEPSYNAGYADSRAMSAYPMMWDDLSLALYPSMGPSRKLQDFSGRRKDVDLTGTYSTDLFERTGSWGYEHTSTGSRTYMPEGIDDLIAQENITIILGYEKTDATTRNSGAFGSTEYGFSEHCGVYLPWGTGGNDGNVYWDFAGNLDGNGRINTTAHGTGKPTMGDDCWAFSSGRRGMEIWQNGKRIAYCATANNRRSLKATGRLAWGTHSALGSDLALYKYFLIYNRQLSSDEIELLSYQPKAPLVLLPDFAFSKAGGSHAKSVTDPMSIIDNAICNADWPRTGSNALGLSSIASAVGDRPVSASSILTLLQDTYNIRGFSHTLQLLQNVLQFNVIGDRQVPENFLGLTDSAHAHGSETLVDDLGLTQDVTFLGPVLGDATQPLGIFDHAHACLAAPWAAIEVSHTIDFNDWTNVPYFLSASNTLGLTDSGERIFTFFHALNFTQTAVAGTSICVTHDLALTDSLGPEIGYERGISHTTLLKDAFTYYIDNGCARQQYNRFEGSGEVAGIEEKPLTFDANFALESLAGTKDLLYLRSPETDDKQRIGYNRVNRETRGGELSVYQDPDWPQTHSLLFTIVALSDGDCYPDKIGTLMDFFQDHLGEEIMVHDWEGITWQGVVTTPNEVAVEDRDGWWTISFEFEGVALDGSKKDQQLSIMDSVGLAADWVRSASDAVGLTDAAVASILGTIEESVAQSLGVSDAVSGSHEHPTLEDDFSGLAGTDLHGQSPDVGSSVWSAHTNYKADGSQTAVNSGAYYPFAPNSGRLYYIEWEARALAENNGDETRLFLGEGLNSLPDDEGGYANGNTDPTTLKAGFVLREVAASQQNACRRGDSLDGQADTVNFSNAALKVEPDDIDLRLILDTSGGVGHWVVTWYAKDPADSIWTEVRASAALLDEDITMLGWSNDNTTTTVNMNNISIIERASL